MLRVVATAMSQGQSRVPPLSSDQQVNTGTTLFPPRCRVSDAVWGWAHRRPIGSGWGGAAVVVRGRESRPHGQGRQRNSRIKEAVMPEDAPPNGGAPTEQTPLGSYGRVSEMQAKLHRWAAADADRRFDDLFNFVFDPATLVVAFDRVATNRGARTAGSDGLTVARIESEVGAPEFLDGLRTQLKSGQFQPQPVRERNIPKPGGSGKVRRLGIPTVADRVVQAAVKLVLEPIFETEVCVVAGRALATQTAPLEMGRRAALAHRPHRAVASHQRRRDHAVQSRGRAYPALPLPGQRDPRPQGTRWLNHPIGRFRGEPDAVRVARPVRRAAWGNGPRAIRAPRPRSTQPPGPTDHPRPADRRRRVPADGGGL